MNTINAREDKPDMTAWVTVEEAAKLLDLKKRQVQNLSVKYNWSKSLPLLNGRLTGIYKISDIREYAEKKNAYFDENFLIERSRKLKEHEKAAPGDFTAEHETTDNSHPHDGEGEGGVSGVPARSAKAVADSNQFLLDIFNTYKKEKEELEKKQEELQKHNGALLEENKATTKQLFEREKTIVLWRVLTIVITVFLTGISIYLYRQYKVYFESLDQAKSKITDLTVQNKSLDVENQYLKNIKDTQLFNDIFNKEKNENFSLNSSALKDIKQ